MIRKQENHIVTLDGPSQSPNANSIENVWFLMTVKITRKHLILLLQHICRSLPVEYAKNFKDDRLQWTMREIRASID